MTIQTVKLSQLILSAHNVRKVKPKDIESLAADMAAHGQLQNLVGYVDGTKLAVCAGGRRYRALKMLAKAGTIANSHPVTIDVRPEAEAVELSLAENAQREAMHTSDAVRAYGQLHAGGMGAEDIAARFGVALSYVNKVLRLSALHPSILAAFAKDEIGMDAAMALTLTEDQNRQLLALKQGRNAHGIRRFLTGEKMGTNNGLFIFVGAATYEAAGGTITADMFDEKGAGYADDPALVEQLASERLEGIEAEYRAQGWSDVRTSLSRPDGYYSFQRMQPQGQRDATPEEAAAQDALTDAMTARIAETKGADTWGDAVLTDLRKQIRAIENGLAFYTDEQRASGAMMLFIDGDGSLEAIAIQTKQQRSKAEGGAAVKPDYSGAMIETLTKIKTLAVQEAIASDPTLALAILIDGLYAQIADERPSYEHPLTFHVDKFNGKVAPELMEDSSIMAVADWQDDCFVAVPSVGRFEAILAMEPEDKARLLAILVAGMVNGVEHSGMGRGARHDRFDRIAFASKVDMRQKWAAPEVFFAKLTKPTMLKALSEAVTTDAAANCANMKKGELAAACAGRIAGRGWLPPALRIEEPSAEVAVEPADGNDEAFDDFEEAA